MSPVTKNLAMRYATYSPNSLNQYSARNVPGYVNVLGTATNTATVSLWSPASTALYTPTTRKGDYFRGEMPFNNSTGAMWLTITNVAVLNDGTNPDIVTNVVGNFLLAKTPEAFMYDADGNLTNDSLWSYTWDAENRLVKQESASTLATAGKRRLEFAYDHQSRRIQKVVSTNNGSAYVAQSTNRFVYDGWNLVATLNSQSALLQSFAWGLDLSGSLQGAGGVGGLLMITDQTTLNNQPSTHFCTYDGNGNVAALVAAASGTVSATYEYGPFSEVVRQTGPMAHANKFRFSTKYQDDESDFLYYGYRSYNPSTGRWLNRDPLAETSVFRFLANAADYQLRLHLESRKFDFSRDIYSFVRNQPLTLVDIDGSRDTPGGEVVINPENRRNPPDGMKLIKVKKCNIRILYGHNWEGEDKWKLGGFQHVWNIVAASDSQPSGCAYAAVLSCNAYNVPNEIPLPGYTPFRGVLPIKDRTADDDLGSEMQKAQKAAREAVAKCCKARCGCKKIEISYEAVGLSLGERLAVPNYPNETIQCPRGKKQK